MYWDLINEQNKRVREIKNVKCANHTREYRKITLGHEKPVRTTAVRRNNRFYIIAIGSCMIFVMLCGGLIYQSNNNNVQTVENVSVAAESEPETVTVEKVIQKPVDDPVDPDTAQFSQTGEYWKVLPYWDSNVGYTGCGLCSYTSAIDIVTGMNYSPIDMMYLRGDWAGMDNYIDDSTGLDGMTHKEFTQNTFGVESYNVDVNIDDLIDVLNQGDVAVLCCAGNVFYDVYGTQYSYPGHFVCAYKYEDGIFYVHDSALEHDLGTAVPYSSDQMQEMIWGTSSIVAYSKR